MLWPANYLKTDSSGNSSVGGTSRRGLTASLLAFLILFCLLIAPNEAEARRYASIVIDAGTGQVLHASNPDRQAYLEWTERWALESSRMGLAAYAAWTDFVWKREAIGHPPETGPGAHDDAALLGREHPVRRLTLEGLRSEGVPPASVALCIATAVRRSPQSPSFTVASTKVAPFNCVAELTPAIASLAMLNRFPAIDAAAKMPFKLDTISPWSCRIQ